MNNNRYLDKFGLEHYHDLIRKGLVEFIEGTQTAATSAWKGKSEKPDIYDGKIILYYLPQDSGATEVTLNLTLSTLATTGAIPCRQADGSSVKYSAGALVPLMYRDGVWLALSIDEAYAKLNSPEFTGAPTAPTATIGTNNNQIATTAFVKAADDVLNARMDTFTNLPSGSTAGDAELQDIRVGYDGTTYASAGAAVRAQISALENNALTSSGLYLQASNTQGYSDANAFPKNSILEISSNITSVHIANLPAYGEIAYVLTSTYNAATTYVMQIYIGTKTIATRIKGISGFSAWTIKSDVEDVVTLDSNVETDHATYNNLIANVSGARIFAVTADNWEDLPKSIKGNATVINTHQSASYDMQICFGRSADQYIGFRVIKRSDRSIFIDWTSPSASLLEGGNMVHAGYTLNAGGGTGTSSRIAITDCPDANITDGYRVERAVDSTGTYGIRSRSEIYCVAGTKYEYSAWVRGTGTVRLRFGGTKYYNFESTEAWQKITFRFTADTSGNYHLYIDNMTLDSYIEICGIDLRLYAPEPEVAGLRQTAHWTPNWFQGSLSPSTGKNINVNVANRVRSEGMVNFKDSIDKTVIITIPEGWKMSGRRYAGPTVADFDLSFPRSGWMRGTYTLPVYDDKYYRFVLCKEDDTDITPDDAQESGVDFSYDTIEKRPEIKILGIGNSHTNNALGYLRPILDKAGYDAKVANYYWGGSTLKEQYDALMGRRAFPSSSVVYYVARDATGTHKYHDGTLVTALADEPWDVIVFQNQTDASGEIEAFFSSEFNINDFIAEVKSRVSNDNLKIGIMAPHSRASDTTVQRLTQNQLDAAIQNTIPVVAANMSQCDFIVNTGLAIKYARQNQYLNAIDDEMTWDDHHLSAGVPRYIAAMVYAIAICGEHIADESHYSSEDETELQLAYLGTLCARAAALNRELPPKFDGISARTVLSIGDSICYGSRNNHKGFLGDLCIMREDASMYGAYLSNYKLGDANNLCIYQQLIDFAGDPYNSDYSPDVIVADGGINDYISNIALGTTPTRPAQNDTDATALNKATLIGGLEHLFYQMIKLYPEAQRFFVLPHRMNNLPWTANTAGYTQTQMAEAIAATCRIYGVELIDVFNHGAVNTAFQQYVSPTPYTEDETVTDKYYVDHDGIHPLALGYKEDYMPLVREALRKGTHKIPAVSASGNVAYLKGGVYGAPLKSVITQIEHGGLTAAHIYVTKKNMLVRPYINDDTFVNRGITFTVQENGTVTASGTVTSRAESNAQPYNALKRTWLQPGVVYSISHGCNHPRAFCVGYFRNYDNTGTITPDGWDVDNNRAISVTYISTLNNGGFHAKRTFYVNEPCILEFQLRFDPDTEAQTITDVVFKPMLYVGGEGVNWDTEPTWEQAEGQRIAVSFDGHPVGEGELNVTTGELTVTHGYKIFDGTENLIRAFTAAGQFPCFTGPSNCFADADVNGDASCSRFEPATIVSTSNNYGFQLYESGGSKNVKFRFENMPETAADMMALVRTWYENGTPLTFVYTLATPYTIQLTPTVVTTLNGNNQIISDTGAISVERRA